MINYDYIIVGSGPAGLTCAYYLSKLNKKVLLIDQNNSVGGCHRVTRVNGLFSEHSPRFYSDAYHNLNNILLDFGSSFKSLFVKMKFNEFTLLKKSIFKFSFNEIFSFTIEFIRMIFDENYSKNTTVETFLTTNKFKEESIKYIDNVCRITEGADIKRYTLFQLLQVINQQLLYNLYQPKLPNDIGLFNLWLNKIIETNNCTVKLNEKVIKLNYKNDKIISISTDNNIIYGNNIILAIPPTCLEKILINSNAINCFNKKNLHEWVEKTKYDNHISFCFHWNTKLNLQNIWEIANTDWGIAWIVLSDYIYFNDSRSFTVISITITNTNNKSSFTNKTANESNKDELYEEVYRQLKEIFINLIKPTDIVFNPNINNINSEWIQEDSGFVTTIDDSFLESQSIQFNNLYNLGTQNGYNYYNFTSIETAISNSIKLIHTLEPSTKTNISIEKPIDIISLMKYLLIMYFILYIFKML
jgi:hypothetical protein